MLTFPQPEKTGPMSSGRQMDGAFRAAESTMILPSVRRGLEKLTEAVEEYPKLAISCIFLPYVVMSLLTAKFAPLQVDEEFTFAVSQLPSFRAIWTALLEVRDNHPPLDYWVRHTVMSILGSSDIAFRLFSVAAFGLAILAIYKSTNRRPGVIYTLLGLLIPFSTPAYDLSFQGRYQVLVLAAGAAAFLSWRAAVERRPYAAFLLAISLGAGILADYNAVLLFVPIALGELARTIQTRRVDLRIWLACAVGASPLLLLYPLIRAVRQFATHFFLPTSIFHALDIYVSLFGRISLAILAFAVLLPLIAGKERRDTVDRDPEPAYYFVAAVGFLLLPICCWVLAKLVTGALGWRYTASAVIGASVLTVYLTRRFAAVFPLAPAALLVCLFLNALGCELGSFVTEARHRRNTDSTELASLVGNVNEPVVLGYTNASMMMLHYAPETLRRRLSYLVDVDIAQKRMGVDTAERGMAGLAGLAPIAVLQYKDFTRRNARFCLIEATEAQVWLVPQLLADGATLNVRGWYHDNPVYDVILPAALTGQLRR